MRWVLTTTRPVTVLLAFADVQRDDYRALPIAVPVLHVGPRRGRRIAGGSRRNESASFINFGVSTK